MTADFDFEVIELKKKDGTPFRVMKILGSEIRKIDPKQKDITLISDDKYYDFVFTRRSGIKPFNELGDYHLHESNLTFWIDNRDAKFPVFRIDMGSDVAVTKITH